MKPAITAEIYGLMAEFHEPTDVVEAAERAYTSGYRKMDGYSPYPLEPLGEALHLHHSRLPLLVLIGGVLGFVGGFALCYWSSVIEYPLNIGGKPLNSWPAFIPPTFETTILFACLSAVIGMLALNGLPQPYHPVFNVPSFVRASQDRFFLAIEASDPKFNPSATKEFLVGLRAREVNNIDH